MFAHYLLHEPLIKRSVLLYPPVDQLLLNDVSGNTEVPPDGTDLKIQVENYLNEGATQPYFCEEGCRQRSQQIRRMAISSVDELEFLTVILTRAQDTLDGYQFVRNRITATSDINIRYFFEINY